MSKAYNSAIVVIPPKIVWEPIQAIRKKLDRNFSRWMPHITMIYPFRPKEQFDALLTPFQEVCNHYEAFHLELNSIQYFQHNKLNFSIWIDPEPNLPLISLQEAISSITPENNDVSKYKGGFRPHLSVGQVRGKSLLSKTLRSIQDSWNTLNFVVDEIYFIWRENSKDSKFRIMNEITLKKSV